MKIIGTTTGAYIVTATKDELCQIAGLNSAYSEEAKKLNLNVGDSLAVSALWGALNHTRTHKEEIANLAKQLRAEADKLDKMNAQVEAPTVELRS